MRSGSCENYLVLKLCVTLAARDNLTGEISRRESTSCSCATRRIKMLQHNLIETEILPGLPTNLPFCGGLGEVGLFYVRPRSVDIA